MQGLGTHLVNIAICAGLFAAAQAAPAGTAVGRESGAAGSAQSPTNLVRLAQASEIARTLEQGRAPVPLARDVKYGAFIPVNMFEPSLNVASIAALKPPPPPPPVVAVAKVETPTFHRASEARWHAMARQGSTELAVTATP
jgi:hypothetical protein